MSKSVSLALVPSIIFCEFSQRRSSTLFSFLFSTSLSFTSGKNSPAIFSFTSKTSAALQTDGLLVFAFSIILSALTVIFLALAGETYAVTVVFLLLLIKGTLLFKYMKADR